MGRPKKAGVSIHSGSGLYRCWYKGKQFYGHTEKEALEKRKAYIKMLEAGLRADARQQTVREFAYLWLPIAKPNVSPKTYDNCVRHIDKMVDVIGDRLLSDVRPSDIKSVFSKKYASKAESEIKHASGLYLSMFDAAVADGLIVRNPARDPAAKPHKGTKTSHRSITPEERDVINKTYHRARPVVMLMLYAGLRNSEALAFDVDLDVDWDRSVLKVQRFRHEYYNIASVSEEGKTPNANREIPLVENLRDALSGVHGLVAPMVNGGGVMTASGWRAMWNSYKNAVEAVMNGCERRRYNARVAAGEVLPPWRSFDVKPYDLRHSFCTWCRDLGVEMHVLQVWMGHSDISMIARVYDHVSDDRILSETEKIKNRQ